MSLLCIGYGFELDKCFRRIYSWLSPEAIIFLIQNIHQSTVKYALGK